MRSAILRFIKKMLVEFLMSLDFMMTRGTMTLPITPMPRMMTQKMMEVVRMYAGNTGFSKSEPLEALEGVGTGLAVLLMKKYGYVELLSEPDTNDEIISDVFGGNGNLRTRVQRFKLG